MSYTLALTPTAPAWHDGQRLLLTVEGELVADVDYRPTGAARPVVAPIAAAPAMDQAGERCASCGFAHALALCQALEQLLGAEVGRRAARVRLVAAELERVSAHLDALSTIMDALGLESVTAQCAELAAEARATLMAFAGPAPARLLLPGGLSRDLDEQAASELRLAAARLARRLFQLADRTVDRRALVARSVELGALGRDAALNFGLSGPLARAAGIAVDVRVDRPYAAYAEVTPTVVSQEGGDVYSRLVVLLLEAVESAKLVGRALDDLPSEGWAGSEPEQLPAGEAESEVEAPRGALRYRIVSDGRRLTTVGAVPAPQLDRLLARALLGQARLDDAALIVLSTAPCAGCATG